MDQPEIDSSASFLCKPKDRNEKLAKLKAASISCLSSKILKQAQGNRHFQIDKLSVNQCCFNSDKIIYG